MLGSEGQPHVGEDEEAVEAGNARVGGHNAAADHHQVEEYVKDSEYEEAVLQSLPAAAAGLHQAAAHPLLGLL